MYKKAQEMCIKAVKIYPNNLEHVPDNLKTQEMCDQAVKDDPYSSKYVADWFVTREWADMWRDGYYDGDDGNHGWYDWYDKFSEWHDGYQKGKAQKARIKKELLPISWHPSRWWIGAFLKTKKERQKKI